MSELHFFSDISLVLVLAAFLSLIMHFLRQPLVIGHILTGAIAGPLLLKDNSSSEILASLSSIGIALLLFIVGFEFSTKVFARLKKPILVITVIQVSFMTLVGAFTAKLFGFTAMESFVIGLALALSSTIIIVKVLSDKREITRLFAQIAIGILIVQDIISTLAKIGLAGQKTHDLESIIFLIARGVLLLLALYLISKFVLPKLTRTLETSKEALLVFAVAWGLGFAYIFELAGYSIEVGALFAGMAIASAPYVQEMSSRLKPLRDFFVIIFFIVLGQSLTSVNLTSVIVPAIIFSLIVLLLKPFIVMVSMGLLGYTKRASFKTALSMSQVSEFSLVFVVAAVASGVVSAQVQAVVSVTALVTFAASAYLMKYDDKLYIKLEHYLRLFERKIIRFEQAGEAHNYSIVVFGYRKGGQEFIRTFKAMKKRFIVVDYDPDAIELLDKQGVHLLYGDATDPELIEEIGLDHAKLIVSTISDYKTNEFLTHWIHNNNPNAVLICSAETATQASLLYSKGAAYVMMPHFIGSEKITTFIKRIGYKKSEFHKYRDKHLQYLQSHFDQTPSNE